MINCSELIEKFSPILDGKVFEYKLFENGVPRAYTFYLIDFFKDLFYDNDVNGDDTAFWWWYNTSETVMRDSGEIFVMNSEVKKHLQPLNDYIKSNNIKTVINDCIKYIEGEDDDRYYYPYDND